MENGRLWKSMIEWKRGVNEISGRRRNRMRQFEEKWEA